MEVERLHKLKDSLYNKASAEAQAKYNAEFGNDQLQEENHFVSRSRTYIIIISILLLGVGGWVLVRQRQLIALQKQRLSEDTQTTILDVALSCGYDDQGAFTRAFKRFYGITPSEYLTRNEHKG
jgi:AraC-like DNA-binding protein